MSPTLILRADQVDRDPAHWLELRRQGIGASDAAAVCGLSTFTTPMAVWLDKTGRLTGNRDTDATRWGRRLEATVLAWFTETANMPVRRSGMFAHPERGWQRATPDGIAADGGVVQVKTTSHWMLEHWADDQVPDDAELQVQHELAVTGRTHGWVAALVDGRRPLLRRVERDDQLISELTGIEERFWTDHVITDVAPPLTGPLPAMSRWRSEEGSTTELTPHLIELFRRLKLAQDKVTDAYNAKETIRAEIATAMGEIEQVVDSSDPEKEPRTCATFRRTRKFAAKRFSDDHPIEARECSVNVPVVSLDVVRERYPHLVPDYLPRVLRVTWKEPQNG